MLGLLLSVASQDVAKAAEPAISTLSQTILGSLLIVSWIIAGIAIWQLIKVQNARIEDKTKDSERIEKLNEKLITVFSEMKNSLDNLTAAEKGGQEVMNRLKQSHDTVLLAAFQNRSLISPSPRE
jgi:uncharacterized protein HemX